MCVARIESHLFDLFGPLQVEMLIFFCLSKEDCNFTLFTKLNSMIDLPRIVSLGLLILNAMHSNSFVHSTKDCGEKRRNTIEAQAMYRCKRFRDISFYMCEHTSQRNRCKRSSRNNNSNKITKNFIHAARKKFT